MQINSMAALFLDAWRWLSSCRHDFCWPLTVHREGQRITYVCCNICGMEYEFDPILWVVLGPITVPSVERQLPERTTLPRLEPEVKRVSRTRRSLRVVSR